MVVTTHLGPSSRRTGPRFIELGGALALASLGLFGCNADSPALSTPTAGGTNAVSGTTNVGGTSPVATGGTSVGANVGGSSALGGNPGTGGQAPNQGGSANQGGVGQGGANTNSGGQTGIGGIAAGGKAAGGATSGNGGTSSGGKATGGIANGGGPSGGKSNGGSSVGGAITAGAPNGGNLTTGGKATAGTTSGIGGAATGGKSNGGSSAGGAATGGSSGNGTGPIKVWIAGDSTVQNCSSPCPCGWGSAFDPLFNGNVTVVNSAVGGRSIQTWLYEGAVSSDLVNGDCTLNSTAYSSRWTAMTDPSSGMKAGDYLLIQFGINDGDSTCPRHVSTTLFQKYLGVMATAAKAAGAQAIFLTSPSAIACSGSTAQTNRGFGTETKAAGTANGVPVIDLTTLSAKLYTSLGLCPNSSDYTSTTSAVGKFFCDDHTHFEAAGAKQIAQVIATALEDQGIGLAKYLL
jgi:lysophospholipase L1-like esterase